MSGNRPERERQQPTPALSSDRLPTIHLGAPHVVTHVGPVVALLCRTGLTRQAVAALAQVFERSARENPARRSGLLVVLAPHIDVRLASDVREALAQVVAQYQGGIAATAVAFEGKGFTATIVRSVVTAIAMMSSVRFPYKVEDSAERGLEWLIGQLGVVGPLAQGQLYGLLSEWRAAHPSIPVP
jgi:hypothetical protein